MRNENDEDVEIEENVCVHLDADSDALVKAVLLLLTDQRYAR